MTRHPTASERAAAAEALHAVASRAATDTRGPKAAVQTVWSGLHGEVYARDDFPYPALRVAFHALGEACGISPPSVTGYLGPQLGRMTAPERAAALRAAADALMGTTFTPHPAPETAPGPGDNLDAGQGPCPVHRPASPGLTHPAAVAPVPGRATARSLHTSPAAALPVRGRSSRGEARDTPPVVARPATPAHPTPPAGARATRNRSVVA